MRRAANLNGVSVKAYAGTTGVILAMDVAGARSIRRTASRATSTSGTGPVSTWRRAASTGRTASSSTALRPRARPSQPGSPRSRRRSTRRARRKSRLAGVELPPKAYTWLSRGLLDRILAFIGAATDARHGLDIAIYEYELPAIRKAVADAAARGVTIRIVYHARAGDEQTSENAKSLETPRRPRPSSASSRRSTGATRRPRRRTTSTG